jgi:chromosome segregation ATPase
MSGRYLGKNINMFLLIIIIISVGSLMVISTYYNERYETISKNNREINEKLKETSTQLIYANNELLHLRGEVDDTLTDAKTSLELYTQKEEELLSATSELKQLRDDFEKAKQELIKQANDLALEKNKNNKLENDIKILENKINTCENDLKKCEEGN